MRISAQSSSAFLHNDYLCRFAYRAPMTDRDKHLAFLRAIESEMGEKISAIATIAKIAPSTLNRFIATPAMERLSTKTLNAVARAAGYSSYEEYVYTKGLPSSGLEAPAGRSWIGQQAAYLPQRKQIPVVAFVGAGSEVHSIDDHAKGTGLEMVDAPGRVNPDKAIALEVRGDSMEPIISDGFLLFYDKRLLDGVLDEWLGKICVVKIVDGPTLVKKVRRGSADGFYHLCSINPKEQDRLDQRVEWCAKVEVMVQR